MKLSQRFEFLLRFAKPISVVLLTVMIVLSAFGAYFCRGLNTEYSISQFLDPTNPLLIAEAKSKADFSLPKWPYVYININLSKSEPGTFLTPERIAVLGKATNEASTYPGVRRAISLATIEGASMVKKDLTVGKLLELTAPTKWADRIFKDPMVSPGLISKDGRTTLAAIEIADVDTVTMRNLPDQLRKTFTTAFPNSHIQIGGIPAIQNEMGQLLKNELGNFIALALLACLMTLAAFFKDKASIVVPIILVGVANVTAISYMVFAKISFTVLSTTLPVLVSIVVLSITTHTMLNFAGDWEQALRLEPNPDKTRVVLKTMRALFLPNFLTALTTSLGFAALLTAKVPLIREYAGCVGVAVILAWFVVMLALPAIMVLLPIPRPRTWTASKARWALHIEKNKKIVVMAVLVIAGMLAWQGRGLNWSARLFDDLPKERESRITSELIDAKLGAIIPLSVVIHSEEADAWNNPERVKALSTLVTEVREIPGVGSAMALSDLIEAGSRAQERDLPDTRAGIAEMIFLYSLSPERVTNQFLTPDGKDTRISVRIRDIPGDQMQEVVHKIRIDTEALFPGMTVDTVGMAANIHIINNELSKSLIYGFWQAIFLISLVLVVVFRSIKWTIVAMLPNLISPIALMGVMAITGTAIKPGIALILSIALGIAYNNTVYLLVRVRMLRKRAEERGEALKALPITKAWYQEGNPCVFSTLALVGGFAIFMASYFELNRLFGAYMLLSIVAGMLGDLIFLPALLSWFPGLLQNGAKAITDTRLGDGKL
jgi:predicted RND superfamily exporter protein